MASNSAAVTEGSATRADPANAPPTRPWAAPADEVLAALATDPERGLTTAEAQRRLARTGPNELATHKPIPGWRRFLQQFRDPLVLLLLAATGVSTATWLLDPDTPLPYEAIAILAIVLLNAIMGYAQQARAEHAIAALRQMTAPQATVIRDGQPVVVLAREIVPGDLLVVEEGATVPADARLLRCAALQVAEAVLTGESLPVTKEAAPLPADVPLADQHNMIFGGTSVTSGRGLAVVVATGMGTRMGQIAGMLEQAPDTATPLQRELARVGRLLGVAVVLIAVVTVAAILLVQDVTTPAGILDVLVFGVALAVAAVPEGLPAVVTVVLALGVQRMAERNAIVRHLSAVETLGSASVIASDKTGTLTRNEMTVRTVVTASGRLELGGTGYAPHGTATVRPAGTAAELPLETADPALRNELQRALTVGDLANNAVLQEEDGRWSVQGDPTEGALLVAARKAGLDDEQLGRFRRIGELPFSSDRKLMTTVHTDAASADRILVFTKGAPDVLLTRCASELNGMEPVPLTDQRRREILAENEALAGQALRTLGVAYRELPPEAVGPHGPDQTVEHDLVFAGLIGMLDPPRAEARDAVARARAAGIRTLMITGDHPVTASVIAAELGISDDRRAVAGTALTQQSDAELVESVRGISVYARVSPRDKLRIVRALQHHGDIIAMTGDGVNDAPALKAADIGVAMGITGTDVSREASDLVLADDNYASIVAAVEEGRAIFANIRKFLRYLLSSNIGEVVTMFFGVLLADLIGLTEAAAGALPLPLLATQILWINLVTDGAPALALGLDPPARDVMRRPPRPRGEGVITGTMWRGILFVGAVMATGTLLTLDASLPGGLIEGSGSLDYGRTMAFTTLVFFSLFTVFNARSDTRSAFVGLFANPWLLGAVALSLLLQVAVVYVPALQQAFATVALSFTDWLWCAAVGSSVLVLREVTKLARRSRP
ncbi:MAG TPA: cation-translocating P-type ATPase [Pseudomonadales bacterium]